MNTDPATALGSLHVRLLWLPDAMPGTLFSALDVLRCAAGILLLQHPTRPCPLTWQIIDASGRRHPLAGSVKVANSPRPRKSVPTRELLILPGLHTRNAPHVGEIAARSLEALQLVAQHAATGGWIATCSTGLIFPVHLGILDGMRLSAPWAYQSWFARIYPGCDFSGDEPMNLNGKVFSCVAPALQTECILGALAKLLGPDLAQACAQVLLHQPQRQQLIPELAENQMLGKTSDSPVYRAMQWLQGHLGQPYQLQLVAAAAATSERTLLRHFQKAVGMTPLEYLHGLRVERAKVLLEVTLQDVRAIAVACGYADAVSFRRLFKRATGINPGEHRERFALRARRPHWRVENAGLKPGENTG